MKETELAKLVIVWLREFQWEVYQEVQAFSYGNIADIVAVQGSLIWVIETKTTFNLEVMAQAYNWKHYAHYVSIAVPSGRMSQGRSFADLILKREGIGRMSVDYLGEIYEKVSPGLHRNPLPNLRNALREEHKTFAEAGNSDKKYYTPFQDTCRQITRAVNKQPGIQAKELIGQINHHYHSTATAKSCILKWAEGGIIKGVEVRREGRLIKLYPKEIPTVRVVRT